MEMNATVLGSKLRGRRRSLGYTQQALADAIGSSRKFVVELEAGKANASLGMALKAMTAVGLDITVAEDGADSGFAEDFARIIREGDYHFAIRLLGEYAHDSLAAGRALMPTAPLLDDDAYRAALGAVTRWIAARTATPAPSWARRAKSADTPVYLAEKLHPVSDRMKELIRSETPIEIASMNVWIRERDLATV